MLMRKRIRTRTGRGKRHDQDDCHATQGRAAQCDSLVSLQLLATKPSTG
jgi:hypothetical protein